MNQNQSTGFRTTVVLSALFLFACGGAQAQTAPSPGDTGSSGTMDESYGAETQDPEDGSLSDIPMSDQPYGQPYPPPEEGNGAPRDSMTDPEDGAFTQDDPLSDEGSEYQEEDFGQWDQPYGSPEQSMDRDPASIDEEEEDELQQDSPADFFQDEGLSPEDEATEGLNGQGAGEM